MLNILVVEDDENYRFEIEEELQKPLKEEATFFYTSSLQEGLRILKKESIDLVLLDIIFPESGAEETLDFKGGLHFLIHLKELYFAGSVIILSSQDKTFAVDLLLKHRNVVEYLFKDSSWKENRTRILSQVEELSQKKSILRQVQKSTPLIGNSSSIEKIRKFAQKLKDSDATVLLTGPSGVGKEVVARYLHAHSQRAGRPFIVLNCAAIPEGLFESQFFGHKKGAFTGAIEDQVGAFDAADGGTLFLDEVGEIPLGLQAKLLRVLQDGKFTPVGQIRERKVDVRVLAATNRNLFQQVEARVFREDLYYRLNVLPLEIPALKDRMEDLPHLIEHFLHQSCSAVGEKKELSPEVIELLVLYGWPGNVRELKNTIERLVILSEGPKISYQHAVEILQFTKGEDFRVQFPVNASDYHQLKQGVLDAFHRRFFTAQLKKQGYSISKTAEITGYNRNDLSALIRRLELPLQD